MRKGIVKNVPLSKRIGQVGGKIRWNIDSNINLVIVESENLERIALTFSDWRDAVVQGSIIGFRE